MIYFVVLVCLLLVVAPGGCDEAIIGSWESAEISPCLFTVEFTVSSFSLFVTPACYLHYRSIVGTYYISNTSVVVRMARPVEILPSKYYSYEFDGVDGLTLTDLVLGMDIKLTRSLSPLGLNGVWDGTVSSLTSPDRDGRFFFSQDLLYFYYNQIDISARLSEYVGTGPITFAIDFDPYSIVWSGYNSATLSDKTISFGVGQTITLTTNRTTSILNGEYVFRDDNYCDNYLRLYNGFYLKMVLGNTNCPRFKFGISQGIYEEDDSTITLDIWDFSLNETNTNTVRYFLNDTNRTLTLDDVVYRKAVQQKRVFSEVSYPYTGSIFSAILTEIKNAFTSDFLGLTLRDYDIVSGINYTVLKRENSESDIVIHERNNEDYRETIQTNTGTIPTGTNIQDESVYFVDGTTSEETDNQEVSTTASETVDIWLIVVICAVVIVVLVVFVLLYFKFGLNSNRFENKKF